MGAVAGLDLRLVRRLPCLVAAALSTATVLLLLPLWVVVAVVAGAIGLFLLSRAGTTAEIERAERLVSLALGSAVGPVVFLLLTGIVAVVP